MNYQLTVILTPQPEGGYTVTCDELPELLTEGDSVDEALENVKDALAATLELYADLERSLPQSIRAPDEQIPAITRPFRFQTMTPKSKSKALSNEDMPVENHSFWFQAIASPDPQ